MCCCMSIRHFDLWFVYFLYSLCNVTTYSRGPVLDEIICMWNINTGIWDAQWTCGVHIPLGGVQRERERGKKIKNLPLTASVASLRCNFLLYISSSAVWEACYSCRCHKKRLSLSLFLPFFPSLFLSLPLSLSLHVFAALIPKQVLQWVCSVGSRYLIVCYFFNTYIMYFIRICCQSLSIPLHPITQLFFFLR